MPELYDLLERGWLLLPERVRARESMALLWHRVGSRFRKHQQGIYTTEYYLSDVEGPALSSSHAMVGAICRQFDVARVVDVGCGTGALLAGFAQRGIEVLGLEYSQAGCQLTAQKGIPVRSFDVRHDEIDPSWGEFDVVCCTEVAEHIAEKFADRLVATLTSLGRRVVFTAATPGQGGTDHLNEQPREYWIEKFRLRQFVVSQDLTQRWSADWKEQGVASWYWKNVLVLHRASETAESVSLDLRR